MKYLKCIALLCSVWATLILNTESLYSQSQQKSLSGTIEIPPKQNATARARGGSYRSRYAMKSETKAEQKTNPYNDVVVYLTPVDGNINVEPLNPQPILNQRNVTFFPRVLPVTKGTTVSIINEEKFITMFSVCHPYKNSILEKDQQELFMTRLSIMQEPYLYSATFTLIWQVMCSFLKLPIS